MKLSGRQVRDIALTINLEIPEAEIESVRLRLAGMLASMADIEHELGTAMDNTEPIPPVYPHDDFLE